MFSHIHVITRNWEAKPHESDWSIFFDWLIFYFKKCATENLFLLFGCWLPLVRFDSGLNAQVVSFLAVRLCRLLRFYFANAFIVNCVLVRCFSLFFCVWNHRISDAIFFAILFLQFSACCFICRAQLFICLPACFFACWHYMCISVFAIFFEIILFFA